MEKNKLGGLVPKSVTPYKKKLDNILHGPHLNALSGGSVRIGAGPTDDCVTRRASGKVMKKIN